MIRPIRITNDVSFMCEKHDTSNQKPQRCVPDIGACRLQRRFADFQREKFFSKSFYRNKNEKKTRKLEWNSFVYFTVDKENNREPARQQRKLKTEREISLSCAFTGAPLSSI